ncbi:MAG TPA: hypothetical protein V6C78_31715 [Crinalium sp.]|jgi:hypothetical protein
MVSRVDQNQKDKAKAVSMDASSSDFNFELWATAVKSQMIASLRRRGEQA